jgi:O-antigen/teichoic acid export membrane protein
VIAELRKLAHHAIIYGSGFLLARALGFLLLPVYTRFLTPEDYGAIELLDLTGFLLGTFMALGMEQAVMKYYHADADPAHRHRVLSSAIIFSTISGLVTVLGILPARGLLARYMLGSARYSGLLYLSFATLLASSLLQLEKTMLRAQQLSALFTKVSLAYIAVAIVLNIYFVAVVRTGPAGIFYSTLITSTVFAAYLAWRIFRQAGLHYEHATLRDMLGYGIYFVPAGLASFVLNWADRYFLRAYGTIEEIGLYALGYRISMIVVLLVAVPFNQIWHSYMFEIEKQPNAREVYARVATYFLGLLTGAALAIGILGRDIVVVMAAPAYLPSYRVIPVLAASMIFFSSDNVFQVGLLIKGHSRRLSSAKWIAAGVNLALNWSLIPRYGMMGAAIATLLSFGFSAALILIRAQTAYYVPFEYRRMAHMGAAAAITYGVSLITPQDPLWLSVAAKLLVWGLFPVLLVGSGFMSGEELATARRGLAELHRLLWRERAPAQF